jgi:hypothetical protein
MRLKPEMERWGKRVGLASIAFVLLTSGCVGLDCQPYLCWGAASLRGELEVPVATERVNAKFCSESRCVEGVVELESADAQHSACVRNEEDEVCFKRPASDRLEVTAFLREPEGSALPDDGERYTLSVVDADSGQELSRVERFADYDDSSDQCHHCWVAEMTL